MGRLWLLAFILFSACSDTQTSTIKNIEAVYMHDNDEFSFLMMSSIGMHTEKFYANTVRFIRDVPEDELMWAEYVDGPSHGCNGTNDELYIHLRPSVKVQGAGWERTEGKTTVNGRVEMIE
jgi:hypothetical protein